MELTELEVAAITVICYLAGVIVKATPFDNNGLIPIVCGLLGGILGSEACSLCLTSGHDFLTAAAVGNRLRAGRHRRQPDWETAHEGRGLVMAIKGVDVSEMNGSVDFQALKAAGINLS